LEPRGEKKKKKGTQSQISEEKKGEKEKKKTSPR